MAGAVRVALRGFEDAHPAERAGFGILGAVAVTVGAARATTYALEQRRPAPALRSLARRAYYAPGGQKLRVHHFLPGMGISAMAGATAILTRKDRREFLLALPFGIGAGLTLDEVALLVQSDNPYWGKERVVLAQAAAAAIGAGGLALRFWRRGAAPAATAASVPGVAR